MLALFLALFSVVVGVQVEAAGSCPAAASVAQRLAALLPARSTARHDRALLVEDGDGVSVELRRADGGLVGRRRLPATGSCDERADAVAVTLASWEAELPSEIAGSLPAATGDTPALALALSPPRPARLAWDADVAFLASIAGGSFAAGATADVLLGQRDFPLAGRVGLAAMDNRAVAVGSGQAAWSRAALTLGPTFTALARTVNLDVHADFLAGLLFLQGRNYASNHSDVAFDPALGGGVRLSMTRWDVTPFVDVTLLGWLRTQSASATESGTVYTASLPRFDVWLRAGLAYGRRK